MHKIFVVIIHKEWLNDKMWLKRPCQAICGRKENKTLKIRIKHDWHYYSNNEFRRNKFEKEAFWNRRGKLTKISEKKRNDCSNLSALKIFSASNKISPSHLQANENTQVSPGGKQQPTENFRQRIRDQKMKAKQSIKRKPPRGKNTWKISPQAG